MAEHVREHMGDSFVTELESGPEQISRLGSGIAEHVRKHLGARLEPEPLAEESPKTPPLGVAALMGTGRGLRQAVVMSEVLGPPRARRGGGHRIL